MCLLLFLFWCFWLNNFSQLNDVEIKETVGGEDRSWGLWHEHRGSIRRYTLQGNSTLVKLSWLKDLKELQQRSSFSNNCRSSYVGYCRNLAK